MSAACRYLTAPEEAEVQWVRRPGQGRGYQTVAAPERSLCAWATYHPTSVAVLTDTPPWLSCAALAGDLVRAASDCTRCPCFIAGEPVE